MNVGFRADSVSDLGLNMEAVEPRQDYGITRIGDVCTERIQSFSTYFYVAAQEY